MISPQTLQALALLCVVKAWKGLWRRGAFFQVFWRIKINKTSDKIDWKAIWFPPSKGFLRICCFETKVSCLLGVPCPLGWPDSIVRLKDWAACFFGILEKSATSISCFQWINNFYCTNGEIVTSNYTDVEGLATKRHSPCWFWIKRSRAPAMATW